MKRGTRMSPNDKMGKAVTQLERLIDKSVLIHTSNSNNEGELYQAWAKVRGTLEVLKDQVYEAQLKEDQALERYYATKKEVS